MGKRTDRVKRRERNRIIQLSVRGSSEREIAKELKRDIRTVKKVLEAVGDSAKSPSDLPKWKEKHWDDLAEAAGYLAKNLRVLQLQYMCLPSKRLYPMYEFEGHVVDGGEARMDAVAEGMSVDPEDVPNPEDIPRPTEKLQKVDRLLASGLIRHLGLDIHDWRDLTKNTKGREIIHELELAALRRTFEGTCEICEGRGR